MNVRPYSDVITAVIEPPIGPIGDVGVIDVGASGGVAPYWCSFGDALVAVGFDPLVNNMRKMAAAEERPRVTYEAAFVGCDEFDALFPPELRQPRVDPYPRSSAVRAQALMQIDFVASDFNEGDAVVWSDRHVTLDERFSSGDALDFLKVDTDGSDLQVLLGAERLLTEGAFLGIMIEAQFQGLPHDYANTFANIDRFLRGHGFQLYDLDLHRYTRHALPAMFEKEIAAETPTGQTLWGDALYFRDLAHPQYEEMWKYVITRERLLKLVALFDLYGLPDCSAELLLARLSLTRESERTHLLDLLVKSAGVDATYADHMKRFEQRTSSFFPSADRPAGTVQPNHGLRARASLKRLLGV
jgi:FkbM family methyltransferase